MILICLAVIAVIGDEHPNIKDFQSQPCVYVGFRGLDTSDEKMAKALDKCKAFLVPIDIAEDQSLCRWKVKPTRESVALMLATFDRAIPASEK